MKRVQKSPTTLISFILFIIIFGGAGPAAALWGSDTAEEENSKNAATTLNDSYSQKIRPMKTVECARCHESVFNTIRDNGGKHRQECRLCHTTFHTYRPGSDWQQAVPNCETCHGEFHGAEFKGCLECHGDPHAPIAGLANMDSLSKNCSTCHNIQSGEVNQYPSAHTELECNECHHSRHGYVPDCTECHTEPHTTFTDNSDCSSCHPAHRPTDIHYSDDTPSAACSSCHEDTVTRLASTTKKHSNLQCAYCHSENHGNIPDCQKCHGVPHSQAMLDLFDGCLECHGDPHALVFPEK